MKTIVLDPGHSYDEPGATQHDGQSESSYTLTLTRAIKAYLLARWQCKVVLTHEGAGVVPGSDLVAELKARGELPNKLAADFFLSLHHNAGPQKAKGGEIYIWTDKRSVDGGLVWLNALNNHKAPKSLRIATDMQPIIRETLAGLGVPWRGAPDRIMCADFAVLRYPDLPCALLETHFGSNPDDDAIMDRPENIERLAAGIAKSLAIALELPVVMAEPPKPTPPANTSEQIERLRERKLINGQHAPKDSLNWDEFATVINRILDQK